MIIGACQIIAMGVQAYWMQRTLTITKQSADAATATVKAMQDTAERELRAYVHPVSAKRFRDDAGIVIIQLKIQNSGQTPAYKCRNGMVEAIYNGFPAPPEAFTNAPSPVGSTVIAPGELIEFFVEAKTISPQDEITIAKKKMAIYLFGEIVYTDAFNKERTTKYRLVCTGEWLRTGRFAPSEQGNEAT